MTDPDPVALVERLKAAARSHTSNCASLHDKEREAFFKEAAAVIQAQAARIAELEGAADFDAIQNEKCTIPDEQKRRMAFRPAEPSNGEGE